MTVSGRLALAMISLVVVTCCVVSTFAWYFVAKAPAQGALIAIVSAALAGGAIAAVFAVALAAGFSEYWLKPAPFADAAKFAMVREAAAPVGSQQMAQAIIDSALDAFVQTDEC